jgi:NTP pyrophosphatase (non-canonical NTP hydrolase)
MTLNNYQDNALRTCPNIGSLNDNINHMMLGLITETGEIADLHKKFFAYGKQFDLIKMELELGDLMWYIACLADMYGLKLDDIAYANINKLKMRFPQNFDGMLAINKDAEAEEKQLSNNKN